MALFDDISAGIDSAKSSLQGVAGTVSKVAGALNSLSNPSALLSSLRSMNVPNTPGGASAMTKVSFGGTGNSADWRVRLSLPPNFFEKSPILKPLVSAGGLVFPYTPSISIQHSAQYDELAITHQNYQYLAYQNSKAEAITISGPFNVEDYVQAQYWIAALHFLRSATKMYTGDTDFQGSPPPILYLNGYGDHVFKNVPVVIKSFNIELPPDVNYIATTVGTPEYSSPAAATGGGGGGAGSSSGLGAAAGLLAGAAGLAGAVGGAKLASSLGKGAAAVGAAAGALNMVSSLGKSLSGAGNAAGAAKAALGGGSFTSTTSATHVPTKSNISVTVQPIYSREAVRQFSLKTFVNGGYVGGSGGYI